MSQDQLEFSPLHCISNTSSEVIAKENKKIERRPIGYRMSYRKN